MKRLYQILMARQFWLLAASMAVVLILASGGWQLTSRWLASKIAQLAVEEKAESTAVYETLLGLDDASVPALVKNATMRDPNIAAASRKTLFTRVDAWSTGATSDNRAKLANRFENLLQKIEEEVPLLTVTGQAWAKKMVDHILNHSSQLREEDRVAVIQLADSLLDEINITPAREDVMPVVVVPPVQANEGLSEPNLIATSEVELIAVPIAEIEPTRIDDQPSVEQPPVAEQEETPNTLAKQNPDWKPDWQANAPDTSPIEKPLEEPSEAERIASVMNQSDRQLLTYIHQNADEIIRATKQREEQNAPTAAGPAGQSKVDSMVPIDAYLIEVQEELVARGYTSLLREEVRLFVSASEDDRLQLIVLLQAGNSGYHARMLLQLAQDESSRVRIAALTTLGTSSRPELVEAAWNLSLRDKDPQVAALADQLGQHLQ